MAMDWLKNSDLYIDIYYFVRSKQNRALTN